MERHFFRRLLRVPRPPRAQAARDVDEEIRHHLECRTEELIAEGLSPEAARRRAEREFGDVEAARAALGPPAEARIRRRRLRRWADDLVRDAAYAWRSLSAARGFAAVAILTLALGIGANTAIFSVAEAVLFRPLPWPAPDRVMAVSELEIGGHPSVNITTATFIDWRNEGESLSALGAYSFPLALALEGDAGEPPELVQTVSMTPDAFRALGASPVLGRTFTAEEGQPGAPRVAVLSHGLWTRRFGGRESVLGETIALDDVDRTVVGVMGPEFAFPHDGVDVWLAVRLPAASDGENRETHRWRGVGRLADGVTPERADAELDAISARLADEFPAEMADFRATVEPWRSALTGDVEPLVWVLLGVVGIVLLIACANLANLFLSRLAARTGELAVRSALGAGRTRLVRQLLVESLLIAAGGLLLGIALGAAGMRGFVALAPEDIPLLDTVRLDRTVLLVAAVTTGLGTLLFGLLPAFRSSRVDPAEALREGARSGTSRGSARLRAGIVVAQVALAVLLLVGAGLLTRSLTALRSVDYGFEPDGLLAVGTRLPAARYPDRPEQDGFYERLMSRVDALPSVESVAGTTEPPIVGYQMTFSFQIRSRPRPADDPYEEDRDLRAVTPGYFRTMGMRILRGRGIEATDRAEAPGVVVINRALAEAEWPGGDPVGERIRFDEEGPWFEVVGVVNDARHRTPERALPALYLPFAQRPWSWMRWLTLMVRAGGDPGALVPPIEEAVWELDDRLPVELATPVPALYAESRARNTFATALLTAFAGLALLLGAVGLYGTLSYAVAQRRRELGIRMALGARRRRVTASVVGNGLKLAGLGLAIGVPGALALGRLLESLLYGVGTRDPLTFLLVPPVLLAAAALAAWVPARRAAGVEPAAVLREA